MNALAVGGMIYQFVSTENRYGPDENGQWQEFNEQFIGANFTHAKLIYSPDNGRTWRNQDGSTPVILEYRKIQSRQNMVFFNEPEGCIRARLSFWLVWTDAAGNQRQSNGADVQGRNA